MKATREKHIEIFVCTVLFSFFFFVNERPLHMLLSTLPFFFFSFILAIFQCHSYRCKCILFHWIPCYGYAALHSIRPSDKYGVCFCSCPHFCNDCLCTSLSSRVFEYIWRLNPKVQLMDQKVDPLTFSSYCQNALPRDSMPSLDQQDERVAFQLLPW